MRIEEVKKLENLIIKNDILKYSVDIYEVKKEIGNLLKSNKLHINKFFVVGRIANRLVLLEIKSNVYLAIAINNPLTKIKSKLWCLNKEIENFDLEYTTMVSLNEKEIQRLLKPITRLIVLYHEENFPYPRFALGVSDICGSVRDAAMGEIRLTDMQTGESVDDVIKIIEREKPDILGFSVTFGQQDILEEFYERVGKIEEYNPLIVLGGSLPYLNKDMLLKKYKDIIICKGYGERTVKDIIKYWYGEIQKEEIAGISYMKEDAILNTEMKNEWEDYGYPELDLLPAILKRKGVMTLECSRGCMNACTFCPRKSKGKWHDINLQNIDDIMFFVSKIFSKYPNVNRKIFLVDEEFFGDWGEENLKKRIIQIVEIFNKYDFKIETSARIKQVYNQEKNQSWHLKRIYMLDYLKKHGLEKCLFGVESGVDSILKRFNKNTTSKENTQAIRLLTSLGVSFRSTYITFDPMMTMEELIESYNYQGRTDIILKENISRKEELYELISDNAYVEKNSKNIPLYYKIPYMLVSLECLKNSAYLEMAKKENLLLTFNLSMGKYNCLYKDKEIGMMSHYSQMWIDRNFALDYFFKSMMKVKRLDISQKIEEFRFVLKKYSYYLLGIFLAYSNKNIDLLPGNVDADTRVFVENLFEEKKNVYEEILDFQFEKLKADVLKNICTITNVLEIDEKNLLNKILSNWEKSEWKIINQ